eukprot:g1098.t1
MWTASSAMSSDRGFSWADSSRMCGGASRTLRKLHQIIDETDSIFAGGGVTSDFSFRKKRDIDILASRGRERAKDKSASYTKRAKVSVVGEDEGKAEFEEKKKTANTANYRVSHRAFQDLRTQMDDISSRVHLLKEERESERENVKEESRRMVDEKLTASLRASKTRELAEISKLRTWLKAQEESSERLKKAFEHLRDDVDSTQSELVQVVETLGSEIVGMRKDRQHRDRRLALMSDSRHATSKRATSANDDGEEGEILVKDPIQEKEAVDEHDFVDNSDVDSNTNMQISNALATMRLLRSSQTSLLRGIGRSTLSSKHLEEPARSVVSSSRILERALENLAESLVADLRKADRRSDRLRSELENSQAKSKTLDADALELRRNVEKLRQDAQATATKRDDDERAIETQSSAIRDLKRQLELSEKESQELKKEAEALRLRIDAFDRTENDTSHELQKAKERSLSLEVELKQLRAELRRNIECENVEKGRVHALEKHLVDEKATTETLRGKIKALILETKTLKLASTEASDALSGIRDDLERERESTANVERVRAAVAKREKDALEKLEIARGELDCARKEIKTIASSKSESDWTAALSEKDAEISRLKKDVQTRVDSRLKELEAKLREKECNLEAGKEEMNTLRERVEAARKKCEASETKIEAHKRLQHSLDMKTKECDDYEKIIQDLRREASESIGSEKELMSKVRIAEKAKADSELALIAARGELSKRDMASKRVESRSKMLEKAVADEKSQHEKVRGELRAALLSRGKSSDEVVAVREQLSQMNSSARNLRETLGAAQGREKAAREEAEFLKTKIVDLKGLYEDKLQKSKASTESEVELRWNAKFKSGTEVLEKALADEKTRHGKTRDDLRVALLSRNESSDETDAMREHLSQMNKLKNQYDAALASELRESEQIRGLEAAHVRVRGEYGECSEGLKEANVALEKTRGELSALTVAMDADRSLEDDLNGKISSLQGHVKGLRSEIESNQARYGVRLNEVIESRRKLEESSRKTLQGQLSRMLSVENECERLRQETAVVADRQRKDEETNRKRKAGALVRLQAVKVEAQQETRAVLESREKIQHEWEGAMLALSTQRMRHEVELEKCKEDCARDEYDLNKTIEELESTNKAAIRTAQELEERERAAVDELKARAEAHAMAINTLEAINADTSRTARELEGRERATIDESRTRAQAHAKEYAELRESIQKCKESRARAVKDLDETVETLQARNTNATRQIQELEEREIAAIDELNARAGVHAKESAELRDSIERHQKETSNFYEEHETTRELFLHKITSLESTHAESVASSRAEQIDAVGDIHARLRRVEEDYARGVAATRETVAENREDAKLASNKCADLERESERLRKAANDYELELQRSENASAHVHGELEELISNHSSEMRAERRKAKKSVKLLLAKNSSLGEELRNATNDHDRRVHELEAAVSSHEKNHLRLSEEWRGAIAGRDMARADLREAKTKLADLERALQEATARADVATYKGTLAKTFEKLTGADDGEEEESDADENIDGGAMSLRASPKPPRTKPPPLTDDDKPPAPASTLPGTSTDDDAVSIGEFSEDFESDEEAKEVHTEHLGVAKFENKDVFVRKTDVASESLANKETAVLIPKLSAKFMSDEPELSAVPSPTPPTPRRRSGAESENVSPSGTVTTASEERLDEGGSSCDVLLMSTYEKEIYEEVFQKLDPANTGQAKAKHIKSILGRTGLPSGILRKIVILSRAMKPSVSNQSCVALCRLLRLVAFAQQGGTVNEDEIAALGSRELQIAAIEGILTPNLENITTSRNDDNVKDGSKDARRTKPTIATPPHTPSSLDRSSFLNDSMAAHTPNSTAGSKDDDGGGSGGIMFPSNSSPSTPVSTMTTPMSARTPLDSPAANSTIGTPTLDVTRGSTALFPGIHPNDSGGSVANVNRRIDSFANDFGITRSELGIGLSTPTAVGVSEGPDSPKSEASADISDISFSEMDGAKEGGGVEFPEDW